ncbi:MAG: MFS transporter [Rhodovarius sp.]|nr:MFS transporter [Rhodovarius sp.]
MSFLSVTLPLGMVNLINQASRAVMAVIGPALAVEFGLSAADLGMLAAVLFVAYALVQLPIGVALDRYGPRLVQAASAAVAGLGFAVSALAEGAGMLAVGRFLTGLGVGSALIGLIKAHSAWYPKERVAALTGAGIFIGGLGGLLATWPVQAALPVLGWRGAFWLLALLSFVIALWILRSVPPSPRREAATPLLQDIAAFAAILRDARFRALVPAIMVLNALHFTYQGLWIGPWLRDVAGLAAEERAVVLLAYALAVMFGNLGAGVAASRLQASGVSPLAVPLAAMALMLGLQALLIAAPPQGLGPALLLWSCFALCGATSAAAYAAVAQGFPPALAGRVSTAVNAGMLCLTFLLQTAIGLVLDLWPRRADGGWQAAGYGWAMGGTLLLQILAMLWMALRLPRR